MDFKECLQELHENFDLPPEEYKNLAGFKELEQYPDIVDSLLVAKCPEAVKLACLSDTISVGEFIYMEKMYAYPFNNEIKDVLHSVKSMRDFQIFVVDLADLSTLGKLSRSIRELSEDLYNKRIMLQKKEKRLFLERKKIIDEHSSEEEISGIEAGNIETPAELINKQEELDDIHNHIENVKLNIQQIKQYSGCIDAAIADYTEGIKRKQKIEKACEVIDRKGIEKFLQEYICTQSIPEQYKKLDNRAKANLLQILSWSTYDTVRLPILVNLHKADVLQLADNAVCKFLLNHGKNVNDYLVAQIENQDELNTKENKILLAVLLYIELENISKSYSCMDIDVWKYITDEKIWLWIFQKLAGIVEEQRIVPIIASTLSRLEDNGEIFVKALLNYEAMDRRFSSLQVAKELLAAGVSSNRKVLFMLLDGLERKQKTFRQKINSLERGERARSQELFSALYQPLEQLEELTVNLMTNKENIPRSMLGSHLASTVILLREGLENMGVYPLVSTEDWQKQRTMPFSEEVHLKPMGKGISKVRLSTMGFKYEDEDGEEKKQLAHVYGPENIKSKTSKKLQPGHHIGNRKGKKVNKQRFKTNNRNNYEVNRHDI